MICKKCDFPKTVILRKKDYYCDDCFMINTNHKFRACIGKNKILVPNENVLICLSGGLGSTVLLDLIHHGISLNNTKKLRIVPHFLHLFDDNSKDVAESVLMQCQKYNFDIYLSHLSTYLNAKAQSLEANCIPAIEGNEIKEFNDILFSMSSSAANDFLLKVKHNLFIKFAKQLSCNIIFTAETTITLATNLLCNLAIGRGSQVQNDVGFSDIRDQNVKILRPMKDLTKEELRYYTDIKHLAPVCKNNVKSNSLQSVISSFVSDLQENFPSTISTVCKTADKIGDFNKDSIYTRCIICKSDLPTKATKLSALEAINMSRTVSYENKNFKHGLENDLDLLNILESDISTSMFPLMNSYLCYGCSRNHSEMSPHKLQLLIEKVLKS